MEKFELFLVVKHEKVNTTTTIADQKQLKATKNTVSVGNFLASY